MRAYARTRPCALSDPAVLAGYMGKSDALDSALASFAMAYAVRTQDDHAQLVKAQGGATDRDKGGAKRRTA